MRETRVSAPHVYVCMSIQTPHFTVSLGRAVFYMYTYAKFPDNEYVIFRTRDHHGMKSELRAAASHSLVREFFARYIHARVWRGIITRERKVYTDIYTGVINSSQWKSKINAETLLTIVRYARVLTAERFNLSNFVNTSSIKARRQLEKLISDGPGVRAAR